MGLYGGGWYKQSKVYTYCVFTHSYAYYCRTQLIEHVKGSVKIVLDHPCWRINRGRINRVVYTVCTYLCLICSILGPSKTTGVISSELFSGWWRGFADVLSALSAMLSNSSFSFETAKLKIKNKNNSNDIYCCYSFHFIKVIK